MDCCGKRVYSRIWTGVLGLRVVQSLTSELETKKSQHHSANVKQSQ